MQRASAALVAVFIVANALAAAVACAGWKSSPAERMACCLEADHGCPDQRLADACCARSEQNQQPVTTVAGPNNASTSAVPLARAVLYPAEYGRSIAAARAFGPSLRLHPPRSPVTRSSILRI
jgi:hypothetical protein